ncbi:hypothetical protein [Mycobacteroides abscessus]|uniref:hypothetical protein n=1 Tax=Mycobacteroides abscessus TaxID=36809 RepID=UPI00092C4618|nr:hypothetical protein [Mycobacteroides abscessus]SHY10642.1 Uncharacterised protein [Mycobacteroides abscessus subsp. abscessus]SID58039.1 Uncharacterised protein [Mycobacteroides abscessus subsp. abscessus]SKO43529.1 Uncharacterised protein [Mycobacteroides abscessus subsp. abscessus]SLJ20547.1 Uncharacterised protein [Mycobacteroides abscessus subsp. abscessus]SLJ24033.1 Uncharacterised protein [Mycobacteroides abscessus subsp. abscessus]
MSAESLAAVEAALSAHIADVDGADHVLTDWFIGYGTMRHDPEVDEGISYCNSYLTSSTSPQGVVGAAHIGLAILGGDLDGRD